MSSFWWAFRDKFRDPSSGSSFQSLLSHLGLLSPWAQPWLLSLALIVSTWWYLRHCIVLTYFFGPGSLHLPDLCYDPIPVLEPPPEPRDAHSHLVVTSVAFAFCTRAVFHFSQRGSTWIWKGLPPWDPPWMEHFPQPNAPYFSHEISFQLSGYSLLSLFYLASKLVTGQRNNLLSKLFSSAVTPPTLELLLHTDQYLENKLTLAALRV